MTQPFCLFKNFPFNHLMKHCGFNNDISNMCKKDYCRKFFNIILYKTHSCAIKDTKITYESLSHKESYSLKVFIYIKWKMKTNESANQNHKNQSRELKWSILVNSLKQMNQIFESQIKKYDSFKQVFYKCESLLKSSEHFNCLFLSWI